MATVLRYFKLILSIIDNSQVIQTISFTDAVQTILSRICPFMMKVFSTEMAMFSSFMFFISAKDCFYEECWPAIISLAKSLLVLLSELRLRNSCCPPASISLAKSLLVLLSELRLRNSCCPPVVSQQVGSPVSCFSVR